MEEKRITPFLDVRMERLERSSLLGLQETNAREFGSSHGAKEWVYINLINKG